MLAADTKEGDYFVVIDERSMFASARKRPVYFRDHDGFHIVDFENRALEDLSEKDVVHSNPSILPLRIVVPALQLTMLEILR